MAAVPAGPSPRASSLDACSAPPLIDSVVSYVAAGYLSSLLPVPDGRLVPSVDRPAGAAHVCVRVCVSNRYAWMDGPYVHMSCL